MQQLLELKQTASVTEYASAFESLRFQLSMNNVYLDETLLVSHFLEGLQEEVRGTVVSQVPEIVDRAITLAEIYEGVLESVGAS